MFDNQVAGETENVLNTGSNVDELDEEDRAVQNAANHCQNLNNLEDTRNNNNIVKLLERERTAHNPENCCGNC